MKGPIQILSVEQSATYPASWEAKISGNLPTKETYIIFLPISHQIPTKNGCIKIMRYSNDCLLAVAQMVLDVKASERNSVYHADQLLLQQLSKNINPWGCSDSGPLGTSRRSPA